jgi:hypothetical protein
MAMTIRLECGGWTGGLPTRNRLTGVTDRLGRAGLDKGFAGHKSGLVCRLGFGYEPESPPFDSGACAFMNCIYQGRISRARMRDTKGNDITPPNWNWKNAL